MNYIRKTYIIILYVILSYCTVNGQNTLVTVTDYTIQNNLSGREVYNFREDSRGFVWISTNFGLNRFDGKKFKHFFTEVNSEYTSKVGAVAEDKDQNIWVSMDSKKDKVLNRDVYAYLIDKNYKIHLIDEYFKGKIPFSAAEIKLIKQTSSYELIILLNSGALYRYQGEFEQIGTELYSGNVIFSKKTSKDGSVYLKDISNSRILKINQQNEVSVIPQSKWFGQYNTLDVNETNIYPSLLQEDSINLIYQNPSDLTNHYHRFTTYLDEAKFSKNFSFYPCYYEDKLYFIGNDDRNIILMNSEGSLLFDFTSYLDDKAIINSTFLFRQNQIWVKTYEGFLIINYKNSTFTHLLQEKKPSSPRSIYPIDDNNVIVASGQGMRLMDVNTGEIQKICPSLTPGTWGITQISEHKYIFGRYGPMVTIFDKRRADEISKNMLLKGGKYLLAEDNWFLNPFKDSQGNIYIGSLYGLVRYEIGEDSLSHFTKYNEFESLKEERVNYFEEDENGVWLATSNGLYLMDIELGIVEHYPITEDSSLHFSVQHIYRELDIFWLATYNNGLIKWNIKTGEFKKFGTNTGFINERLTAIYPDKEQYLWVASEGGLIHFNKETEQFSTLSESDGLTHREFNRASHCQMPDGRILLGGMRGINAFYPGQEMERKTKKYPFLVTSYVEFGSKRGDLMDKTDVFLENQKIVLEPGVNSFKIDFSLIKFNSQIYTSYEYKINGYRDEIIQQRESEVRINGLPYGDYNLEVRVFQSNEAISEKLIIPISVLRPFYQKNSWRLFAIFSLVGLAYFIYNKQKRDAKEREKILEQTVQERTLTINKQRHDLEELNSMKNRLFAIIGHDLRNPVLSFKNIPEKIDYLINKKDFNRIQEFGRFIGNEAHYLHNLLENLLYWALIQEDNKKILKTPISILDIIKDVKEENEHQIKSNGLSFEINIVEDALVLGDYLLLKTIFRNLISNAFRYTPSGGKISVKGYSKNETVVIELKDTGRGINKEQISKLFQIVENRKSEGPKDGISFGLFICKELVEAMGGNIQAASEENKGSIFTISLLKG